MCRHSDLENPNLKKKNGGEGRREAERRSRVGSVKPLVLLSKHTLTFPHHDHHLCVSSETTNRTLQPLLPPSSTLHTRDHQGTAPAAVSQHRPGLCCLQVAMWGTTSTRRWRRTNHQCEDAGEKTGALRPSGSGGLQRRAGGWEPSGTLVAFETTSSLVAKMASQSQGIQQLLQAEKRAAEKVADARKSELPLSSGRRI